MSYHHLVPPIQNNHWSSGSQHIAGVHRMLPGRQRRRRRGEGSRRDRGRRRVRNRRGRIGRAAPSSPGTWPPPPASEPSPVAMPSWIEGAMGNPLAVLRSDRSDLGWQWHGVLLLMEGYAQGSRPAGGWTPASA